MCVYVSGAGEDSDRHPPGVERILQTLPQPEGTRLETTHALTDIQKKTTTLTQA